jgi:DNA repair exonuclease SbcCD nuclease subunit
VGQNRCAPDEDEVDTDMKIAHISDIHIRSLQRHDEYRRSFERLFSDLRVVAPDAVVITGDIVHSKTQGMTPELIDFLTWFFRALANISDVHVVLGNHDMNLSNLSRQDAVSPVINAINDSRIKLYKKSGVYSFANGFNWCVFSICDKDGWKNVAPISGDINIALFHGPVDGSTSDSGYELDAEVGVSFFNGYDFVMLGDIHAQQFLNRRGRDRTCAYAGSLIQQSHGENADKGYLLWDIKSSDDFDVKFMPLLHENAFFTVDWKGSLENTLSAAKQLPPGSRVRIRHDVFVSQVELKQLTNELTVCGMNEVVFKDEHNVSMDVVSANKSVLKKRDLRDPEVMFGLLQGYIGEKVFSGDEWMRIKDTVCDYTKRASLDDDTARNVQWSLKKLWFENTFGYGASNFINFEKLNGITGIFGQNRIGKSSIIGTLLYTIFNGNDRGCTKNVDIVNSRKQSCRSKLVATINDTDYMIERQTVKSEARGVLRAVTNLNFAEIDDNGDVISDLNGEQRTDTEKTVRSLFGSAEDCMLSAIAVQGEMNKFIDAGPTYRDQVISRFLDIVIFEKMLAYAKDDASDVKAELKNFPEKNYNTVIATKENELDTLATMILEAEEKLSEKRNELDELKLKHAKMSMNPITYSDVKSLEEDISNCENAVASLSENLERSSATKKKLNDDIVLVKEQLSKIDTTELNAQLKSASAIRESLSSLRQSYEKEKQILAAQKKSVLRLADVPCGDAFPTCMYIRDSHADKAKVHLQHNAVDALSTSISEIEKTLAAINVESIEKQLFASTKLTKKESELELAASKLDSDIDTKNRKLAELKNTIAANSEKLEDYRKRAQDDIEPLNVSIRALQKTVSELDAKRVSLASKSGSLCTEIASLKKEQERFKELKSRWHIHEMLLDALSKKGLPAQIIKSQLPAINAEIAKILHGVVDYTVRLEKDDTSSTDIYIDYGDTARLIELGSGMEKMIASLAIRVALLNASTLPKPDFIVIDEGFGSLDESNIEACNRLLVSLKHYFKNIVIISHIDSVKDIADGVIEVVRNGLDSFVDAG